MPVTPTYPGVYIQELPSGVHTITGVATSVGAFVDYFSRGPLNTPVQVFSWGDVVKTFGDVDTRSEASFALDQFFRNGGSSAWVVRVTNSATPATTADVSVNTTATGSTLALTMAATSPGAWGNSLRVRVDQSAGAATFDVVAREVAVVNGTENIVSEVRYAGVSANPGDLNFVQAVVNDAAANADGIIVVPAVGTPVAGVGPVPLASGYLSASVTTLAAPLNATGAKALTVTLLSHGLANDARAVDLGPDPMLTVADLAGRLQGAIRSAPTTSTTLPPSRVEFTQATVNLVGPNLDQLQIVPGVGAEPAVRFTFGPGGAGTVATAAGLDVPSRSNIACYALGTNPTPDGQAQHGTGNTVGTDGDEPAGTDLIGQHSIKPFTGMYSLDAADIFNLLCLPRTAKVSTAAASADNFNPAQLIPTITDATNYVHDRRAMLLLDPPDNVITPAEMRQWMSTIDSLRDPNVAVHYPREIIADPTNGFRDRSIGASGSIAGLCGRIDTARGVWKAPAGTEATVAGITRFESTLTDAENGTLNPIGINVLRTFPTYGNVNWGGRTSFGEDVRASDWKYVPVRRLALYLEETLFRSTKWVIFEPNDEPLWAQIRLSVGSFMADLFHKGAFQGLTKQDAYFVHCDSTTTSPLDQQRGVVNLVVGFAPLKPAEFLIITIQQIPPALEV
jgi:uncharacterized protein